MKTNRFLTVMGVACTLLAGAALADLSAADFQVLDTFPGVTDVVGLDALADGTFVAYADDAIWAGDKNGAAFQAVDGDFTGFGGGFVAAAPAAAEALVGDGSAALWLVNFAGETPVAEAVMLDEGDTFGANYGEYLDADNILISKSVMGTGELGVVSLNSPAIYTKVVNFNTDAIPVGSVLLGDLVYVGTDTGQIRAFAAATLLNAALVEKELGELEWEDGAFVGNGFPSLGPTSSTADGDLIVSGAGGFWVVSVEGEILSTVDFEEEALNLAVRNAANDRILAANDEGVARLQKVTSEPWWTVLLRFLLPLAGLILLIILILGLM